MNKSLAALNGVLLALMIFSNALVAKHVGPYFGTFIFHAVGLAALLVMASLSRRKLNFKNIPPYALIPGLLSLLIILLNNICITKIGATLLSALVLSGQIVSSSFIEHHGLFHSRKQPLQQTKVLGFLLMGIGIVSMTLF